MQVVTIGPGKRDWVVKAHWMGADRIVFGPTDVFTASQWMERNK